VCVGSTTCHLPRGLPSAVGRVPQCLSHPLHSSGLDERKSPRVCGPKARWKVYTQLLKVVQPFGTVFAESSEHG
jgi:hypothetical protein